MLPAATTHNQASEMYVVSIARKFNDIFGIACALFTQCSGLINYSVDLIATSKLRRIAK